MNRLIVFFLLFILLASCETTSKPKLHLYIWSDAIEPSLLRDFEEKYGCTIVLDTYDSNEALYAKLTLGAIGYDLIFPSNYLIGLMAHKGIIAPLSSERIPNLKNIDPRYPAFQPNKELYGIPYLVSYTGLAYRKDKVKNFTPTWKIFADKQYKGRMTMLNDVRETLGASLISLGSSVNSIQPEEIEKAADQLINWKRNLAKFESEQYKNGIASAEYLIVQGYGGDILQVMNENPLVAFAYPEEGSTYSIDYAALLKEAPEPLLAHAFINFLLEPEVSKRNTLFTFYLHPCKPAYNLLPLELQSNQILFPPQEVLIKAQPIESIGSALKLYTQAWDRAKEE